MALVAAASTRKRPVLGLPGAFPRSQHTGLWYVLGANVLYQSAAVGIFTYLAASLRRTYGLTAR